MGFVILNLKIYHYKPNIKEFIIYWFVVCILSLIGSCTPLLFSPIYFFSLVIFIISLLLFYIFYYYIFFNRASINPEGVISIPAKHNEAELNTYWTPDYTLHCYKFVISNIKKAYIIKDLNEIEEAKNIIKHDIPLSKLGWELVKDRTLCIHFINPLLKDYNKRTNYSKDKPIEFVYLPISKPEEMLDDINYFNQVIND